MLIISVSRGCFKEFSMKVGEEQFTEIQENTESDWLTVDTTHADIWLVPGQRWQTLKALMH